MSVIHRVPAISRPTRAQVRRFAGQGGGGGGGGIPQPSGTIFRDTRPGGAHSIESANTLAEALSAAGFSIEDDDRLPAGYEVGLSTDVDGQGGRAWYVPWRQGGPNLTPPCLSPANTNHEQKTHINRYVNRSGPVFYQHERLFGRTATGGGVGVVGSFQNRNTSCGPGGRKNHIQFRENGTQTGNAGRITVAMDTDITISINSSTTSSQTSHPFPPGITDLDDYNGSWLTISMWMVPCSVDGADDGIFRMWLNADLVVDLTNIDLLDRDWAGAQQVGPTWTTPPQDQTENVRNAVWSDDYEIN